MAVLLVTGCIGVILSACVFFPGTFAAVVPYLPEGSNPETDSVPGNASSLGIEAGYNATVLSGLESDDERLESLIARTSVPLLEHVVGQIYSMHAHDDAALRDRAVVISSLAGSARADAVALEVSPRITSAHADFITALDEFIAAGSLLDGSVPLDQSITDEALSHLALGTERLSDAMQECNCSPVDTPGTLTNLAVAPVPVFPDALQNGERFCYDDTRGQNSASLIVGQVRTIHSFQTIGLKPKKYTAKPGESFLLVTIKATHLGHRGDGTNDRLRIPGESAFTLHYLGETYRPMKTPGPTNQGESYSGIALGRHESVEGFLFFEVPENLDLSFTYLEASIGGDRPVWLLSGEGAA